MSHADDDVQLIARAVVAFATLVAELVVERNAPRAPANLPMTLAATGQPIRVLRRAIREGELVAVKVGREYRVTPLALAAWLETRTVSPRTAPPPTSDPGDIAFERALAEGKIRLVGGRR